MTTHTLLNNMLAYGDGYLELRISRKLLIAIVASILVHSLLFIYIHPEVNINIQRVKATDNVLSVQLAPQQPSASQATPRQAASKEKVQEQPRKQPATPHHSAKISTPPPVKPADKALPSKPAIPDNTGNPAPTDMSSYINAVRARRQMAEHEGNASSQPTEEEIRNANIQRNLKPQGGGGIFQITNMGTRTANFTFRGWDSTYNNGKRQDIEVDAGSDGNLELAVIRKMIVIIRQRHKGNFNWESQRLNRIITLSARVEDNEGLEDFMMREFFNSGRRPSEQ